MYVHGAKSGQNLLKNSALHSCIDLSLQTDVYVNCAFVTF
jgi:hypothetical protein